MSITVMYDIAQLGYGHVYSYYRTGIHRVTEQVALGLRGNPEVNLILCASEAGNLAADYIRSSPAFRGMPLHYDHIGAFLTSVSHDLTREIERASMGRLPLRLVRRLFFETLKVWRRGVPEVKCIDGLDLYHSQYYPIPRSFLSNNRVRRVLTVHDIIPIRFPNFVLAGGDFIPRKAISTLMADDWVICDSECTRNDLLNFRRDLNPDRVRVVYLATMDSFRPAEDNRAIEHVRRRYGIPDGPYILSLSTIEIRKNIDAVIRVYGRLASAGKLHGVSLVLAGPKGWKDGAIFDAISKFPELSGKIVMTGFVDDADLPVLYSGAMLFAFPSLYEGFGLPVLEAMKCGTPVVCSNTSSLPEITGNACFLIDPQNEEELEWAFLRLFESGELRTEMARRGVAQAQQFGWNETAMHTVSVYKEALST